MRVLDIGCFGGKLVQELLAAGKNAYGCDIDTSRFIPEIKDRLFKLDITKKLPAKLLEKKFDIIYFGEVLEHLEEGKDVIALENIYSLLKDGGILYLTTPKSIPHYEDWDPAWVRWKLNLGERHYHYSMEELFTKLSRVGFKFENVRVTGNLWWLFCRWVNLPLKHIFKMKKLLQAPKRKGYFDWEVVVRK